MTQGRTFRIATQTRRGKTADYDQDFRCLQCGFAVVSLPDITGVQNRNHCPYCLWSRHLDWREPGDRLSACRAGMQPVGLTVKQRRNKYAAERDGELMLVHECTECAKVVINRIAADDDSVVLFALWEQSHLVSDDFLADLARSGVTLLGVDDYGLLCRRLLGAHDACTSSSLLLVQ